MSVRVHKGKPTIGAHVSVIVESPIVQRYNQITGRCDPDKFEYAGTVTDAEWLPSDQFAMTTEQRSFPIRVICVEHIISITIDGNACSLQVVKPQPRRTVTIDGSRPGSKYTVTIENGRPCSCTCPGFGFRRTCKHITANYDRS